MSGKLSMKLLLSDVDLLEADMSRDAAFDELRARGGLTADEVNDLLDMFEDATDAVKAVTDTCRDYEDQLADLETRLDEEAVISEQRADRIDACLCMLHDTVSLLDGSVKKSQIRDKLTAALRSLEP